MRKTVSAMMVTAAVLAACGGGDDDAFTNPPGAAPGGGPPGSTTVQLGSPAGAGFQPGVLSLSSTSLSAGGSASVQVALQKADGTLYTDSADISFNSPCVAQGLATINSPITTSTGIASTTYVATGCSGDDVITATVTINGVSLTATGTLNVAQAAIGSIEFVSATPTNIALQGTGASGRPETSTVVFRVLDSSGGPRAGAQVAFSLNTSVGGVRLSSPADGTAISDAQGRVQAVVQAGTRATPVRVTARILDLTPQISTQSSQLTITTGIPDQDSFSLAVKCPNVEALYIDGVQVPVTARLSDRFNNPVPDGTAVTFMTEGGSIESQCTTTTTSTESGVCTVNWTSAQPRPADGRVTLLATAIGEESFTDRNGNGAFDPGDGFETAQGLPTTQDLPEPFLDANEDGVYDSNTEDFYDFDDNKQRTPADGLFNGVLCNDPARCGTTEASRTTGIGASAVIVMSGSAATITPPAAFNMPTQSSRTVTFEVRDENGNAMPAGTTVALSANGAGLSVAAPSSYSVPCSAAGINDIVEGVTHFNYVLNSGTTTGSGTITLRVTSPGGIQRSETVNVTVP